MSCKDPEKQKEYLKRYHREYHQTRVKKRKDEMIVYLGDKCVECSSTKDLEFDHIDPSNKEFAIMKRWTLSWEKMVVELDKCQLLCHKCHKKKTASQSHKGQELQHGDWRRYKYQYCRCDLCRISYRERRKRWR